MKKRQRKKVNKAIPINTIQSNEAALGAGFQQNRRRRGLQIYSPAQLMGMTGRDKDGRLISWGVEQPYFYLTTEQRNQIFKLSSIIFGIVSRRMKKISSLDFNVMPTKKMEDQLADEMKDQRSLYMDYKDDISLDKLAMKSRIYINLKATLPDLKSDLSNFDNCMLRWKRAIQRTNEQSGDQIKDWMLEPNNGVTWEDYIQKVVYDLHIHGNHATYKDYQDGRLQNFDSLVGGSVWKVRSPYFSASNAYVQFIAGMEPQSFFDDEIMFMQYLPSSIQSHSFVPLETLINMISETLLFDGWSAERADGNAPPEKLVVITENSPFGTLDSLDTGIPIPMDADEQKRLETRLNTPRKNKIMTFSGNRIEVVDLSMDNKADYYNTRKKDIREECAMVFNMSNLEINMTGSEDTSGRATSESQMEIDQQGGYYPIARLIQTNFNKYILPLHSGPGWMFEFQKAKNEKEERELDALKLANGELTINELREEKGRGQFQDDIYNKPKDAQPADGSSEQNALFTRGI